MLAIFRVVNRVGFPLMEKKLNFKSSHKFSLRPKNCLKPSRSYAFFEPIFLIYFLIKKHAGKIESQKRKKLIFLG